MTHDLVATYRLQLGPGFGFDQAAALAEYLERLGVSHAYCSPYLQAAPGSSHGYDVVDPHRVNRELGGREAHARFCAALRRAGLGQILDIVPNHMAIGTPENRWWWDVLENGPSSRYAAYFDVDWDPPEQRFQNTILLPILGDQYGRVLEAGQLRLEREGARFTVRYTDRVFPCAPRSLGRLLRAAAERAPSDMLAFVGRALEDLPDPTATDRDSIERRHGDQQVLRRLLARTLEEEPATPAAIDSVIEEINAAPDRLHGLLEHQNYRLAFWRVAGRDLGYRRFFDINTLIGLRSEDADVFADTHRLVLQWLDEGLLDGIRVDHPDGLRDPKGYLERLRSAAARTMIFVEKILVRDECLPADWPVEGTTGYEFMNLALGLLIDSAAEQALTDLHTEMTGTADSFAETAHQAKLTVLRDLLGSDVRRLTALFLQICELHPRHRDHTREEIERTLRETIACFPAYRSYVRAGSESAGTEDARRIEEAIEAAKERRSDLDPDLLSFLGRILLRQIPGDLATELALRFQQVTGPAMAKGVEDTAFYRFHRLVCQNEVGGDPRCFGVSIEEFHRHCGRIQERWPRTMLATSTHDTKRSEDVRARLALLSEIPARWAQSVRRWRDLNRRHRRGDFPDSAAEYLLYQTWVGAWPISTDRLVAYMEKAAREAKIHTSWTRQNGDYDAALRSFAEDVANDPAMVAEIESFVAPLIEPGRVNSLSQVLLKLSAPGVPDIYRGTELWDLSLVDPDNRRPVDWEIRRRLLDELDVLSPEEIRRRSDEGLPKLWLIRQALLLRRRRPGPFGPQGEYRPLDVHGSRAEHALAFARGGVVATVIPRLVIGLAGDWADTTVALPAGVWCNELTGDRLDGGRVRLDDLCARFPVALLSKEETGG